MDCLKEYVDKNLPYRNTIVVVSELSKLRLTDSYPRHMDDFILLQEALGEVVGLISLSTKYT